MKRHPGLKSCLRSSVVSEEEVLISDETWASSLGWLGGASFTDRSGDLDISFK
jgi:hypothetical protein